MAACTRRASSSVDHTIRQRDTTEIDINGYDLHKETERIRTFIDNNWNNSNVSYNELALLGFFFQRKPDQVQCFFCSVYLSDFEPHDDLVKEHLKFSPNCRLLRRRETHNVPINAEELDRALPPASIDECGSRRRRSKAEDHVAYPQYRLPSERMKTFKYWPKSLNQKPKDLVEAGFFYTEKSDIVCCFSCGLFAGEWEVNDNPWVEHKKLESNPCNYLRMNQEILKINEKKFGELEFPKPAVREPKEEKEINFDTSCKICMSRNATVVFLPCKHAAVCGSCVFGIGDNCPICRTHIEEKIPIIFP